MQQPCPLHRPAGSCRALCLPGPCASSLQSELKHAACKEPELLKIISCVHESITVLLKEHSLMFLSCMVSVKPERSLQKGSQR